MAPPSRYIIILRLINNRIPQTLMDHILDKCTIEYWPWHSHRWHIYLNLKELIITSSPTKSCALDPIPTWLLKQCLDQVAPVLTVIVNTSSSCADFTPELKRAFVTPLIKKLILDCVIFKNYRPVCNLSFVSKLIERIICVQLVDHLKENDLYEIFQLHTDNSTALKQHCFECKMTYSKLWILKEEPY